MMISIIIFNIDNYLLNSCLFLLCSYGFMQPELNFDFHEETQKT